MRMSDNLRDFDKKNEAPKNKTDLADEITQALGINGVYVSVSLTNEEMHLNKLDFSEHDKQFKERIGFLTRKHEKLFDENQELKQRIAELESKETVDLPFDPLECANYLINATYERETSSLERGLKGLPEKVDSDRYTVDDLEQIAEHLLVYCKHNKDFEDDGK